MKYITFSNYVNSWSLNKGLKQLGLQLDLETNKSGLLKKNRRPLENGSTLFFTEENSLIKFMSKKELYIFEPRELNERYIDDKFCFAKFLESIGETPIPYTSFNDYPSSLPIYLKAKHSWKNDLKLPRGYICNTENDYKCAINQIERNSFKPEWFFQQKLLMSEIENNFSVSGYFDYKNNKRNLLIITRKLKGDHEKIATGAIIELVIDPEKLYQRTINILNSLNYSGPFELEFFYEKHDDCYYVLELNPRFWMQHGLIIDLYENGLIKRYLNMDSEKDWYDKGIPPFKSAIWIDSIIFLKNLSKGKNIVSGIDIEKKMFYPNISHATLYLIKSIFRKMFK